MTSHPPDRSGSPAERAATTLTDAETLSAYANPQRSRIMDVLSLHGPSTASAIAQRTSMAVGSASHHLKVLEQAGLVEQAPELARDRRERWWRPTSRRVRWSRHEFTDDPAAMSAAEEAEMLTLRRQYDRTLGWLTELAESELFDSNAFATQGWAHLSHDELGEIGAEIVEVINRWCSRPVPEDQVEREAVYLFARGFPAQP